MGNPRVHRKKIGDVLVDVLILENFETRPCSDRELMDALIAVGNGKAVELCSGPGHSSELKKADRAEIRRRLELFIADPAKLFAETILPPLGVGLIDIGAELGVIRTRRVSKLGGGRGLKLAYRDDYPDLRAAMKLATLLLLDRTLEYGATLSRCRLERCQQFYFAARNPKGGPLNRNYCCPEHRDEAHNSKQNRSPREKK